MRFRTPSPTGQRELETPETKAAWASSPPISKSGRRSLDSGCSTACPSPNVDFFASPYQLGRFRFDADCSTPVTSPSMNFDGFPQLPFGPAPGRLSNLGFGLQTVPSCANFAEMKLILECDSPALILDSDDALVTPPSTPRKPSEDLAVCWTPPVAPVRSKRPPLPTALMNRNHDAVEQVLQQEPDSVRTPFWNHDVEPPLCTAVRLLCSAKVISPLLAHGADVNCEDCHGRTPLTVLRSSTLEAAQTSLVSGFESTAVEEALLNAGAAVAADNGVMINTLWQQTSAQLPVENDGGFCLPWASTPSIDTEQDFSD